MQEETKKKSKSFNPVKIVKKDIRYVAFGDSISAGWNAKLPQDYPGKMLGEQSSRYKKIIGLSYPAYLARFIDEIDSGVLQSFNNYGLSGSTLEHWNLLFEKKYEQLKETKFYEPLKENEDEFIDNLKKANLVTISLGANDFLEELFVYDLWTFFDIRFSDEALKNLKIVKQKTIANITNGVKRLVQNIRQNNKSVVINFVSYPMPMIQLVNALDKKFKIAHHVRNNFSEDMLAWLNGTLKKVISKLKEEDESINYIEIYDDEFWLKNKNLLTSATFDIHPNEYGYKKIAQEIISKIIVSKKGRLTNSENKKYLEADEKTLTPFLQITNQIDKTKLIIYGNKNDYLFFKDSTIEQYEHQFNIENLVNRTVSGSVFFKTYIPSLLQSIFASKFMITFDDNKMLQSFILEGDNIIKFLNSIINYRYFNHVYVLIQNQIYANIREDVSYTIDFKELSKTVANTLSNIESLSLLLESFANSELMKTPSNISKFMNIISVLIYQYINEKTEIKSKLIESFKNWINIKTDSANYIFDELLSLENITAVIKNVIKTLKEKANSGSINDDEELFFISVIKEAFLKTFFHYIPSITRIIKTNESILESLSFKISNLFNNYSIDKKFIQSTQLLIKELIKVFDNKEMIFNFAKSFLNNINFYDISSNNYLDIFKKTSSNIVKDKNVVRTEFVNFILEWVKDFFNNQKNTEIFNQWIEDFFSDANVRGGFVHTLFQKYIFESKNTSRSISFGRRALKLNESLNKFIDVIFFSLAKCYTLTRIKHPDRKYYEIRSYRNMFRINALLQLIVYENTPVKSVYWARENYGIYYLLKRRISSATKKGITFFNNYRDTNDIFLLNDNLIESMYGSQDKNTKFKEYSSDQLLIYIYLKGSSEKPTIDRFQPDKNMSEVLIDYIIRGYSRQDLNTEKISKNAVIINEVRELKDDDKVYLLSNEQTKSLLDVSASDYLSRWYKNHLPKNVFVSNSINSWIAEGDDKDITFTLKAKNGAINIANLNLLFKNSPDYFNQEAHDAFYNVKYKRENSSDFIYVKVAKNNLSQINKYITQKIIFNDKITEIVITFLKDLQPRYVSIVSLTIDIFASASDSNTENIFHKKRQLKLFSL
ncbi:SGNH/GDSL hydrolase family protein [Mycoplasmopsis agassizii]|uniref:SGNH/GDSL hydrolase family protein n=1 Tax=Mycoplasmopsis agassizii TaxID=33922 RepID=UPI0035280350